jgi:integrase/recombinase XerC
MADLFKVWHVRGGKKVRSAEWYGKIKLAPKHWRNAKLFTDKEASRTELANRQKEADRRAVGLVNADSDRLRLPIAELVKQYTSALEQERCDEDHRRISGWMLDKLVEECGWQRFGDVTEASVRKLLDTLEKQGATASYRNKFIVRAKAFVNWLLPEGETSPLSRLKRIREKGAKRTRDRRAATSEELNALLLLKLPPHRKLAYALAGLNGMRRNEAASLTWGDIKLTAVVPFVELRMKQGGTDHRDAIPLHPYVLGLLRAAMPGMPATAVLPAVPDVATLKKDWKGAGVAFKDDAGRRLDFHALRHTFATALDMRGCSRATKKKLMRHASGDVTDGYTHSDLAEMRAALDRLPSPVQPAADVQAKTGTHDHRQDQTTDTMRQFGAQPCKGLTSPIGWSGVALPLPNHGKTSGFVASVQRSAQGDLMPAGASDNLVLPRPDTQVD